MIRYLWTSFLILVVSLNAYATHIVGGELSYESLGGNQYRITLKIYRDCINGVAPFDNPASVGIFTAGGGSLINEVLISNPTITDLPIVVTNPCLQVPPIICTQEAIYQGIVTINIPSGGVDLVYQRCCRNDIIQNINTPDDMGSTYSTHIPDPSIATNNNGAHFTNVPPLVLCNGDDFVFDHSATDIDGDLLVYEMCTPFHGANSLNPMPQPPNGGPYTNISWSTGFGVNNQINGTQNLQINSSTGELICTPTTNGVYVVGICVKEYRNGQLINTTLRDFQFTVVSCSSTIISAVPDQSVLCDGYTMDFTNQSVNGMFYHWDFGVASLTNDTSILEEPIYTYPDTGNYEVTLIANPGWPCADTSTAMYTVQYPIQGSIDNVTNQCAEGNSFDFGINGNFTSSASFNWNFGGASIPLSSSLQAPQDVSYSSDGSYIVSSSVNDRGCYREFTNLIEVFEMPEAIIPDLENCDGLTINSVNNSTQATNYFWDFGDLTTLADTSLLSTPSYTYGATGVYTVTLIANNANCSDTAEANYKVKEPMSPDVTVNDPIQCLIGNSYDLNLTGNYTAAATFEWSFGSPTTTNNNTTVENPSDVSYLVPGVHLITVTIEDEGCEKDTTIEVDVIKEPTASFLDIDNCESLTALATNTSIDANTYFWDFGDLTTSADNSTAINPSYSYPASDTYTVTLIAFNDHCSDTTQGIFKVKEPINPSFTTNLNPQCITTNSFDFNLTGNYTSGATFTWDFGGNSLPLTSASESPSTIIYDTEGYYLVSATVLDEGCTATIIDTAKVFPSPEIKFSISDTVGCMPLSTSFIDESIAWGDVDYFWDFGNGVTSTEQQPSYVYENPGVYDVSFSLTTNEGCLETLTSSSLEAITVYPRPIADFNVNPEATTIFFPDVEFTDLSIGDIVNQFYTVEGNDIIGADVGYSLQTMGQIPILQTVINSYGCIDTLRKFVFVEPNDVLYIPNSFTPNGDGVNDLFKPSAFGILEYEFYIFNRWGAIIYEGDESALGWDGTSKNGKIVEDEAYIWQIRYRNHDNKPDEKRGHVLIIK
jgi:gliding motility-associated-like protein